MTWFGHFWSSWWQNFLHNLPTYLVTFWLFEVKTVVVTFWATFEKFGLLFILTSDHSGSVQKYLKTFLVLSFEIWSVLFKKWASPGLFFLFLMGHSQPLLFIFVFSIQLTENNVQYNLLPMTGFELRTSGIGSNCSTNWATTTAPITFFFIFVFSARATVNNKCSLIIFSNGCSDCV